MSGEGGAPATRVFLALVEDRPGTLNRVVSLFRRRSFNIESLTVGRTERPGISRLTLVVRADPDTAARIEANLYKLVPVLSVEDMTGSGAIVRELLLVKVRADAGSRAALLACCEAFAARPVEMGSTFITFALADGVEIVDALLSALAPFGIVELVRTGAVALPSSRGPAPSHPPLTKESPCPSKSPLPG